MKKLTLLLLVITTLLSTCLLASCSKEPIKERAVLPSEDGTPFEIQFSWVDTGNGDVLSTVTYGCDEQGNIFVHYNAKLPNKASYNEVYVKKDGKNYEHFKMDMLNGEDTYTSKGIKDYTGHGHIGLPIEVDGYFRHAQTLVSANGYAFEKIDALSLDDNTVKELLDNSNCTYYKLTKAGKDDVEVAIQNETNMMLYCGIKKANGSYATNYATTVYKFDHLDDYSDLVK